MRYTLPPTPHTPQVRELAEELAGAPEEVAMAAALPGGDSLAAVRTRHRLEARAAEEEELFTRVRLSKVCVCVFCGALWQLQGGSAASNCRLGFLEPNFPTP